MAIGVGSVAGAVTAVVLSSTSVVALCRSGCVQYRSLDVDARDVAEVALMSSESSVVWRHRRWIGRSMTYTATVFWRCWM